MEGWGVQRVMTESIQNFIQIKNKYFYIFEVTDEFSSCNKQRQKINISKNVRFTEQRRGHVYC